MAREKKKFNPGDYYIDCALHPVICTKSDHWDLEGISLVDGSHRFCSIRNCGPQKVSRTAAFKWKKEGPPEAQKKKVLALKKNGWANMDDWWNRQAYKQKVGDLVVDIDDMSDDALRLMCGEMTAQEMRTAKAVLNWAKSKLVGMFS